MDRFPVLRHHLIAPVLLASTDHSSLVWRIGDATARAVPWLCGGTTGPDHADHGWLALLWLASLALLVAVGALVWIVSRYHRRLRREVALRTRELAEKNATLLKEINERITLEQTLVTSRAEQKSSAEALHDSQILNEQIMQAAPGIVYIYDVPGHAVLYSSRHFAEALGYASDEIAAMGDAYMQRLLHPSDVACLPELTRRRAAALDGEVAVSEFRMLDKSGAWRWFIRRETVLKRGSDGSVSQLVGTVNDITDRTRTRDLLQAEEARDRALLALSQKHDASINEILDAALDAALLVTGSAIGYIYFYNEETQLFTLYSWSKSAMSECTVMEKQSTYALDKTGLWGEAVRRRAPIIANDYAAPSPHKRGIPTGHVPLKRFLTIPVFNKNAIVAVFGVANKHDPYDDADVRHLAVLADGVWRIRNRLESEAQIRSLNERLEQKVEERTAQLRKTHEELERFFAVTVDLLCIANTDGVLLRVNQAWVRALGYKTSELEGRKFLDLVHPDDLDATLNAVSQLVSGKDVVGFTNRYRASDGSYRMIEWRSTAVGSLIYASAQDVTERKRSEAALRDLTERFILATTSARVGVWDWDLITNRLVWTDRMYQLYGLSAEQLAGSAAGWRRTMHPDDAPRVDRDIEDAVAGRRSFESEFRVVWPDGATRHLKAYANVYRDAAGAAVRMIGTNWDITAEREVQRDLTAAMQEAERANRAKSEFLANMSHEIRTPLNAVIGYSDLLGSLLTDTTHRGYTTSIAAAGKSLLRLINDILDMSKIEAGRMDVRLAPVDVKALFVEVEQIFAMKSREKGLVFRIDMHCDVPTRMLLDEARVRQILLNLVGNAVKFTDRGRVSVSVGWQPEAGRATTGELIITVEDTGIGISEADQSVIFEPFKQVAGQSARFGGTGLGLSISKKLVEMMDGDISVSSTPGVGSVFTARLRGVVTSRSDVSAETSAPPAAAAFEPATVLVVDDIESNRRMLNAMLKHAGLWTLEACDGSEAVRLAGEHHPNLIIMDVRMPVMDGITATRMLKSSPATEAIPVVVITASVKIDAGAGGELHGVGFAGHLTKPVTRAALFSELGRHLRRRAEHPTPERGTGDVGTPIAMADLPPGAQDAVAAEILPAARHLSGAVKMDDARALGRRIAELGALHGSSPLTSVGRALLHGAETFDVSAIRRALNRLLGTPSSLEHAGDA